MNRPENEEISTWNPVVAIFLVDLLYPEGRGFGRRIDELCCTNERVGALS